MNCTPVRPGLSPAARCRTACARKAAGGFAHGVIRPLPKRAINSQTDQSTKRAYAFRNVFGETLFMTQHWRVALAALSAAFIAQPAGSSKPVTSVIYPARTRVSAGPAGGASRCSARVAFIEIPAGVFVFGGGGGGGDRGRFPEQCRWCHHTRRRHG